MAALGMPAFRYRCGSLVEPAGRSSELIGSGKAIEAPLTPDEPLLREGPQMRISRRDFMQAAAAIGASLAWGGRARASRTNWREQRNLYPEGVASGDPDPHSVILWTRRPFEEGRHILTVEVAEDADFHRVIAQAPAPVSTASDWTTRVLVAGLEPARVYWYRFTDADGSGSRVGRTITAPAAD